MADVLKYLEILHKVHDAYGKAKDLKEYYEVLQKVDKINPKKPKESDFAIFRSEKMKKVLKRHREKRNLVATAAKKRPMQPEDDRLKAWESWSKIYEREGQDSKKTEQAKIRWVIEVYNYDSEIKNVIADIMKGLGKLKDQINWYTLCWKCCDQVKKLIKTVGKLPVIWTTAHHCNLVQSYQDLELMQKIQTETIGHYKTTMKTIAKELPIFRNQRRDNRKWMAFAKKAIEPAAVMP